MLAPSEGSVLRGCAILGVHAEGPFLSKDRPGAHPPEYIQSPKDGEESVLRCYEDIRNVKLVTLAPELEDMKPYIQDNRMADYQDHYYPSEMAVDAQIQTFLINQDVDAFLKKFDKDWIRYNRDIIRMMEDYEAGK